MDNTKKVRILKVSVMHLALTVVVCLAAVMLYSVFDFDPMKYPDHDFPAWANSWKYIFLLFQPLIWLVSASHLLSHFSSGIQFAICLLLIPLWSFCFGWLFIRAKDWLNHFPVLGKRVF